MLSMLVLQNDNGLHVAFQGGSKLFLPYDRTSEGLFAVSWNIFLFGLLDFIILYNFVLLDYSMPLWYMTTSRRMKIPFFMHSLLSQFCLAYMMLSAW